MSKKLTLLLCALLLVSITAFAGCKKEHGQVAASGDYETIYSFESQDEINSIKAFWDFGKMQISTGNVTEGGGSMRLEVHGTYPDYHFVFGDWFPIDDQYLLFYVRDNPYMQLADGDWSRFESLLLDFASESDRDVPVQMYLTTITMKYDSGAKAMKESENDIYMGSYTVKQGKSRQTAEFKIPVSARFNDLNNVKYVKLIFPNREEGQKPAVLYVDHFRAKKAAGSRELNKNFQVGEIAFFESDLDANAWCTSFSSCQYESRFTYRSENDKNNTTEGFRALAIERKASPKLFNWNGSVKANLGRGYLDLIDFTAYDPAATSISVDLYSVSPVEENATFTVQADTSTLTKSAALAPYTWTTISIPMSWNGGDWSKVYGMGIEMNEFLGADRLLYVDHIRFVVNE